jgi:ATP-dependent RNA helicase DeaD
MTRLFLRVGKRHGVRPADLVGAIANEAGISGEEIGDIDLYDAFSFVEVPSARAEQVLRALKSSRIRGQEPQPTIARPADADANGATARPARRRPFNHG